MAKRICKLSNLIISILLLFSVAFAAGTRTWEQSKFEDLEKGTTDGIAVRSDGSLELAPTFKALSTMASPYVWSIAADESGNVYAATGTPARVYRITPDGKSIAVFQSQELQVQALAVGTNGTLYAATNPDGKIYRIEPGAALNAPGKKRNDKSPEADSTWKSSVFFDPGSKYIWDLALDKFGNLYAATGDHGEVFRITPTGDHAVFFKSDEANIRVLRFDHHGNLIAGSDGSGLIYRISPSGEGFVLYSAPKKEITAIVVDANENIYAAATGEKRNSPNIPTISIPSPSSTAASMPSNVSSIGLAMNNPVTSASIPQGSFGNPVPNGSGGSEIYRISSDGAPTTVWSSHEDLVYALTFNANGEMLAGTGNRGHILKISAENKFTDLLKATAGQITSFARAPQNGLYASSSNLGKIFLLGGSPNPNGTYLSDVFDAHIFSQWGHAQFRGTGTVELFARSGNVDNPDRNWSKWGKINLQKDAAIDAPPARFIQWKAVLYAGNEPPRVESVTINYLSKNVAPVFDEVTVQEGTRYQPSTRLSVDTGTNARTDNLPLPAHDRNSMGVKWSIHDDNDDDMVYSIYYRGEGENRWFLLKDNLIDRFYSFDSSLLPDGAYNVKVVASDAPSHSPGQGLSTERESARFEMDTTAPRIEDLRGSLERNSIHVTMRAVDSFSPILKAEYSVDAGIWQLIEPVGQISDSRTENYDFRVNLGQEDSPLTEHAVIVRVFDRHENVSSSKTVVRAK